MKNPNRGGRGAIILVIFGPSVLDNLPFKKVVKLLRYDIEKLRDLNDLRVGGRLLLKGALRLLSAQQSVGVRHNASNLKGPAEALPEGLRHKKASPSRYAILSAVSSP
ncbi:MAG: hypothetical protein GTN64_02250 [Candidatus Latescibacteria bacterium]|nr:hypothetical protein [Candidatus Latescibacterota bacterium]NIO77438.1 hypothetical protein [Candidatus Latescibacterota bacterium]